MKRTLYLIIGTMAMCVYGLMYNRTVFAPAIQEELNVSVSSTANVFSFCQIFLTIGGLVSGFIYHKVS